VDFFQSITRTKLSILETGYKFISCNLFSIYHF